MLFQAPGVQITIIFKQMEDGVVDSKLEQFDN